MDAEPKKGTWFGMDVSQRGPKALCPAMVEVLTEDGSRTSQRGQERLEEIYVQPSVPWTRNQLHQPQPCSKKSSPHFPQELDKVGIK